MNKTATVLPPVEIDRSIWNLIDSKTQDNILDGYRRYLIRGLNGQMSFCKQSLLLPRSKNDKTALFS